MSQDKDNPSSFFFIYSPAGSSSYFSENHHTWHLPFQMALAPKFSYQRLVHEGGFDDEYEVIRERVTGKEKNWFRTRKVHIRRRLRVRIPSLRRFLRKKARMVVLSWTKVVKRLKESRSHFGDLFAGNYLFMQVTPTPLKSSFEKSFKGGHDLHRLSSRYSLPRIAS